MNRLRHGLLWLAAVTVGTQAAAQPPAGSQLPLEENRCATCHGESDLWDQEHRRLYIAPESLADDLHLRKGVNCHDCHGGNPATTQVREAHAADGVPEGNVLLFRPQLKLERQVKACGHCHPKELQSYEASVHGRGLLLSGLVVSAVCTDCHGAHGIYPASDERSPLHVTKVTATCAKCHRFIEARLAQSVHGLGKAAEASTTAAITGGAVKRKPNCIDCHVEHDLPGRDSGRFRRGLPNRCAQCHPQQSDRYALSMHGHLTELGYGPAAMCADCHGAHDIRPLSDPASQLSASQRLATCAKCHPNASPNFASFDPHADHRDPQRSLLLNAVYTVLLTFLCTTFGFFGLHSVLWFLRSLVDVLQHGRPQGLVPGAPAYVRFTSRHRVAHTFMVLSFLGLAATGLPLKYSHCQWAQTLAAAFGGFESTSTWHRLFGVVNIALLVSHVFWLLGRWVVARRNGASPLSLVFGPDSPVPNWRDVKDFQNMLRWLVGQGRKPTFERWAYWEKYDFWGACADIVAIGSTGLVLWFPNLFCTFLPGETLNIAKVIHSTQALLATGFVFAIHFFNTHVRPEKFPMDLSVLTGLISEHEAEEERPDFLERMRRAGRLEELRTTVPARSRILLITFGGTCALVVGLALLAGIVLPMFSK